MKKSFEEPSAVVECFALTDQTLFLSGIELGENELDPAYGVPAYQD